MNYCRKCHSKLTKIKRTLLTGIIRETDYFSKIPKKIEGKNYYRTLCGECFKIQIGREPKAPNIINGDFTILLEVPLTVIEKIQVKRAVTLKNLQERHGETKGLQKFNDYRERQAYSNSFEYKKQKHNWTKKEFDTFNKKRAVTLKNLQERHGETKGLQKFNDYRERQAYTNKLSYYEEKFGLEQGVKEYKKVNKKKAQTLENFQKRYGVDKGVKKYLEKNEKIKNNCAYYSNISQELFLEIYKKLPVSLKEKTYYFSLNKEFNKIEGGNIYFYDFVISSLKYCIEFNGEHVHPRKDNMSEQEWKEWRNAWDYEETAQEKYDKDNYKNGLLTKEGFNVRIIWYKDYIKNKNTIIQDIVNEIYNKI